MTNQKSDEGKEVAKRRDAILKKMLETPPKPHPSKSKAPPKGTKDDGNKP